MNRRRERPRAWAGDDLEPEDGVESVAAAPVAGEEEPPEFALEAPTHAEPPAVERGKPVEPGEPADPVSAVPALRGEDPLREFSDNARKRYDLEVSTFAADLRKQSLARRRSQGGDSVSGRNVTSAAFFLRSHRANGFLKYLGAVGGLLVGLGAQSLGGMMEDGVYTAGRVLWGVSTAVAGVALFTWHATRDR